MASTSNVPPVPPKKMKLFPIGDKPPQDNENKSNDDNTDEEDDDYDHLDFEDEALTKKIERFQFQHYLSIENEKRLVNLLKHFYHEFTEEKRYYHIVCDPRYLSDLVRCLTQLDLFVYPFVNKRKDVTGTIIYGSLIVRIPITYPTDIEKILYDFKVHIRRLYRPRWLWGSLYREFTSPLALIRFIVHIQTIQGIDCTGQWFYHHAQTDYLLFKNGKEVDMFLRKHFPKSIFELLTREDGQVVESYTLNPNWKLIQYVFIH